MDGLKLPEGYRWEIEYRNQPFIGPTVRARIKRHIYTVEEAEVGFNCPVDTEAVVRDRVFTAAHKAHDRFMGARLAKNRRWRQVAKDVEAELNGKVVV